MSWYAIHGQMNILTPLFNDHYRFLKPGPYILALPSNVYFNDTRESCKQSEGGVGSLMKERNGEIVPSGQGSIFPC